MANTERFDNSINKELAEKGQKERAISAIIATNAQISPEQFQALKNAIGQEVAIVYHHHGYSVENDEDFDQEWTKSFILKDVRFVRDSATKQLYLAFFRFENDSYDRFPYTHAHNDLGECDRHEIHSLSPPSGEALWSFDSPGEQLEWRSEENSVWDTLYHHSESMLALREDQKK